MSVTIYVYIQVLIWIMWDKSLYSYTMLYLQRKPSECKRKKPTRSPWSLDLVVPDEADATTALNLSPLSPVARKSVWPASSQMTGTPTGAAEEAQGDCQEVSHLPPCAKRRQHTASNTGTSGLKSVSQEPRARHPVKTTPGAATVVFDPGHRPRHFGGS